MDSYKILNNDLTFDERGYLALSSRLTSFAERLKFDLESNSNWFFRDTLGCEWVNENGNGLLQQKGTEEIIEGYLRDKIRTYEEVLSIEEFEVVFDKSNREATANITVKTSEENIKLEVNL